MQRRVTCYVGQSRPGVWDQHGIAHSTAACRFTDRLIIVNYHV